MDSGKPRVVIIGGGMIGTSIAWWLSATPAFGGEVLVLEPDPSYAMASTSHTNSCIRLQFSNPLNIAISKFGVEFIRNFRRFIGDPTAPDIFFDEFGYLYLADQPSAAAVLQRAQQLQRSEGASTEYLDASEIAQRWSFINANDLVGGSFGSANEGYFDSGTMFAELRRQARKNGVRYLAHAAVDITTQIDVVRGGRRVKGVVASDGVELRADWVVNAAGPRAAEVAAMLSIDLPVEPRKRHSWVFRCATDLGGVLPLTIDPSGVHVRSDGDAFLAGAHADADPPVAVDDFTVDPDLFEHKVWPALAHRVPAFERVKVINSWVGHYAFNTLDQNAIVGPAPETTNFIFANGFSGHGLQQAPAVGRGVAEWISYGGYRTLDLAELGYERVVRNERFGEANII